MLILKCIHSYRNYYRRKTFKSPVKYPKRKGLQIGRVTDLNLRDYCQTGKVILFQVNPVERRLTGALAPTPH